MFHTSKTAESDKKKLRIHTIDSRVRNKLFLRKSDRKKLKIWLTENENYINEMYITSDGNYVFFYGDFR